MKQSNFYDNIFINLALICFQLPQIKQNLYSYFVFK